MYKHKENNMSSIKNLKKVMKILYRKLNSYRNLMKDLGIFHTYN